MTEDRRQRKGCRVHYFRDLSSTLETIHSLEINSHTRQSADDLKSKYSPIQAVYSAIEFSWLGPPFTPGGFFSSFFAAPQRGGLTDEKIFGDSYATNHLYSRTTVQKKTKQKTKTKKKNAFQSRPRKRKRKNTVTVTKQLEHSQPSNFFPRCYIIQSCS